MFDTKGSLEFDDQTIYKDLAITPVYNEKLHYLLCKLRQNECNLCRVVAKALLIHWVGVITNLPTTNVRVSQLH